MKFVILTRVDTARKEPQPEIVNLDLVQRMFPTVNGTTALMFADGFCLDVKETIPEIEAKMESPQLAPAIRRYMTDLRNALVGDPAIASKAAWRIHTMEEIDKLLHIYA